MGFPGHSEVKGNVIDWKGDAVIVDWQSPELLVMAKKIAAKEVAAQVAAEVWDLIGPSLVKELKESRKELIQMAKSQVEADFARRIAEYVEDAMERLY